MQKELGIVLRLINEQQAQLLHFIHTLRSPAYVKLFDFADFHGNKHHSTTGSD
jgi:hypothetical protein